MGTALPQAERDADPEADTSSDARGVPVWVAWVAQARRGDRRAFGQLHGVFARMVHGILLSWVSPADANDLVQDVFLAAMQKLPDLREDRAFGAWLAQMARSRARDLHRSRRAIAAEPERLAPSPEERQEVQEILSAIRELPEAYRETLVLRLVEGMTGPEIAEETGLTAGSVRVNLHRGMKLLRDKLGLEAVDE